MAVSTQSAVCAILCDVPSACLHCAYVAISVSQCRSNYGVCGRGLLLCTEVNECLVTFSHCQTVKVGEDILSSHNSNTN